MPRSTNPNRYRDIQILCEVALTKGEAIWQADPDKGRSIGTLRHRFYSYLKIIEHMDPDHPYLRLGASLPEGRKGTIVRIADKGEIAIDGLLTEYDEADLDLNRGLLIDPDGTANEEAEDLSPLERAKKMLGEDSPSGSIV